MDTLTIAVAAACLVARPAPPGLEGRDYQVLSVEFTAYSPASRRGMGGYLDGLHLRVWQYHGQTVLDLDDLVCDDHRLIDCSECWPAVGSQAWFDQLEEG